MRRRTLPYCLCSRKAKPPVVALHLFEDTNLYFLFLLIKGSIMDTVQYIKDAREVLRIEADTLFSLEKNLDEQSFVQAVEVILHSQGRVVVTGMGKSGPLHWRHLVRRHFLYIQGRPLTAIWV